MTENEFKNQIFSFLQYDAAMLEQFFDYWSEPNKKGTMRFELEKTWDLKRRLKRWYENQIQWHFKNNNNGKQQQQSSLRDQVQAELNKRYGSGQ